MTPKNKTILLILLCFALGAVAGYFAERYYSGSRPVRRPDPVQIRREFAERLHLDSTQVAGVDSLMDSHRKKMDDIRRLFSADRDSMRADIRKLLNPDQKKLYDASIKEMEARDTRKRDGDKQQTK
jgi:hypothetical protein